MTYEVVGFVCLICKDRRDTCAFCREQRYYPCLSCDADLICPKIRDLTPRTFTANIMKERLTEPHRKRKSGAPYHDGDAKIAKDESHADRAVLCDADDLTTREIVGHLQTTAKRKMITV